MRVNVAHSELDAAVASAPENEELSNLFNFVKSFFPFCALGASNKRYYVPLCPTYFFILPKIQAVIIPYKRLDTSEKWNDA